MLRWAKITEEIGADERLCGLAERNTMAALLFTWSLPKADVYAIIPGSATEYRARVCPGMDITKAEVQKCIDAQVKAGLLYPYSDNGKQLLYIINFHKHQSIKWGRVGQPLNNLPHCWRTPQELRQYMEEEDCDRQPAFYGLTDALEPKSRTTPGLVGDYSGENALDVDVDPNVDKTIKGLLSEAASPPPDAPPQPPLGEPDPEEPKLPKKPKSDRATIEQQLEALREPLSDEDIGLIDAYLDNCAAENDSGEITLGRRLNETRDLIALRDGNGQTVGLGVQPWRYGMQQANRAGAPNHTYVRKAAGSWQPHQSGGSRTSGTGGGYPRGTAIPSKPEEFGEGQVDWDEVERRVENGRRA